jgi:hypothetical protein
MPVSPLARKGGVIVIQEIFGLSDHIKEMAERLGAAGYEAIAPSMYDRAERGFIVQPKDVAAGMTRGRELAMGNGQDNALNDIGGVFDVLSKSEGLHHRLLLWRLDELAGCRAHRRSRRRLMLLWRQHSADDRHDAEMPHHLPLRRERTRTSRWSARSTRSGAHRKSRSTSTTPVAASRRNSSDYDAAADVSFGADAGAVCRHMKLIFIWGGRLRGKLRRARVARLTGLPLFHNHLVVDALLSDSHSVIRNSSACARRCG